MTQDGKTAIARTDPAQPPLARTAEFIGQATAIEQARAVAEVQAAIVVAQQCPRDMDKAVREMRRSTGERGLAERAFFRYNRAGSQVTGPTIHMARELARCFGNVQYGIAELRRDDDAGISEMQAYAWDVETNTRSAQIFIVPHKRDKRGGTVQLTELRDIYENNANMGARRVREAIFAILPPWLVEEAKDRCVKALQDPGDTPPDQRIADAVAGFQRLGVSADQLEQKLGRTSARWTDQDFAQLSIVYKSLERGEATVEEEFPAKRVTADEITGSSEPASQADVDAENDWVRAVQGEGASDA